MGGDVSSGATADGAYRSAPNFSTTFDFWSPAEETETPWTYTLSEEADVDTIALLFKDVGSLKVQYYNGSWEDLYDDIPPDNSPMMLFFSASDVTRFRISITNGGQLISARIGVSMVMPHSTYGGHSPIDLNRTVTTVANQSASGEFLGKTTLRGALGGSLTWEHIPVQWVRDEWEPFKIEAESETFFLAWRPDYGSAQGNDVAYVLDTSFSDSPLQGGSKRQTVGFTATARSWK